MERERPILFSDAMVRAILAGTKTQTRRVIELRGLRPSPTLGYDWTWRGRAPIRSIRGQRIGSCWQDVSTEKLLSLCPCGGPGDRLWVRETWRVRDWPLRTIELRDGPQPGHRLTREDESWWERWGKRSEGGRWQPSIHMPRWASRLTLEVTSVRVERLQSITDEDARAEGVTVLDWYESSEQPIAADRHGRSYGSHPHVAFFAELWDSVATDGAEWAQDPWVWAIGFRVIGGER